MKKTLKLFKTVFDALLVLIIVCALALLLAPRLLGAKLLVVLSQSMEPTIPMGAVVISRPVPTSDIKAGDVITFRSPDPTGGYAVITHRVVEVVGSGLGVRFRTQGDAAEEPDVALVQPMHLIGRMWFRLPLAGYLVGFIRTPMGFATLVGLPAVLLVAGEAGEIIQTLREHKHQKSAEAPLNPGGKS